MTPSGGSVLTAFERERFDVFTGVPCSLIEGLLAALERDPRGRYVPAVREDAALGLAAGAWFAGRRPVVLMQNSGLGTGLNALASLSIMYGLPALLVVTWRGQGGGDAPEHGLMGEITPALLGLLGIPFRIISDDSLDADLAWAAHEMDARMTPVALLVPASTAGFASQGAATAPSDTSPRIARAKPALDEEQNKAVEAKISRFEAIGAAVKALGTEPVIHANGYPSRESCAIADRPQNFYMLGSMGLASAIALGLALHRHSSPTVVFDGDGNVLMNLGILAMVGATRPPRLVHCVFDNEVYGSTGNQRSLSADVRLDRLAAAAGYRTTRLVTDAGEVTDALRAMLATPGPHFLLVKVTSDEADVPRVPHEPAAIRDRFRASLAAR